MAADTAVASQIVCTVRSPQCGAVLLLYINGAPCIYWGGVARNCIA